MDENPYFTQQKLLQKSMEKIDPFTEEALSNDEFFAPQEQISVSIDVEQIPSIWKRIKGWFK